MLGILQERQILKTTMNTTQRFQRTGFWTPQCQHFSSQESQGLPLANSVYSLKRNEKQNHTSCLPNFTDIFYNVRGTSLSGMSQELIQVDSISEHFKNYCHVCLFLLSTIPWYKNWSTQGQASLAWELLWGPAISLYSKQSLEHLKRWFTQWCLTVLPQIFIFAFLPHVNFHC